MTDIVERLRSNFQTKGDLLDQAADEIERLRDTLAEIETIAERAGWPRHVTNSYWDRYEKQIIGAMKNTIDDHGPITKDLISSVMKRIRGQKANNDDPCS